MKSSLAKCPFIYSRTPLDWFSNVHMMSSEISGHQIWLDLSSSMIKIWFECLSCNLYILLWVFSLNNIILFDILRILQTTLFFNKFCHKKREITLIYCKIASVKEDMREKIIYGLKFWANLHKEWKWKNIIWVLVQL